MTVQLVFRRPNVSNDLRCLVWCENSRPNCYSKVVGCTSVSKILCALPVYFRLVNSRS